MILEERGDGREEMGIEGEVGLEFELGFTEEVNVKG